MAWGWAVSTGFEWPGPPRGQGLELVAPSPPRFQQPRLHLQPLAFLLLIARERGRLRPGLTIPHSAWPLPRFLGPPPRHPAEPTYL